PPPAQHSPYQSTRASSSHGVPRAAGASRCCTGSLLAWGSSPLGAFGELRERLWRKQRGAAEALLEQLGQRREELRALRDAVGTGAASVLRVYEEKAAELGLEETLRRGARRPSLADVLEGLQDVERYYRHLYLESKLLLLSISCDSPEDMEALPQAWKRILERYEEGTVQGSCSRGRPKGCLLAREAEGLPIIQLLCWAQ
uniref:Chromosome 1 open reading frame 109 n=1 Tax=Anas zonorhyncha TaxID=75864 RepID=A0A8B9VPW9_9AVES